MAGEDEENEIFGLGNVRFLWMDVSLDYEL
jgi:hypothetical protein